MKGKSNKRADTGKLIQSDQGVLGLVLSTWEEDDDGTYLLSCELILIID